MILLRCTKPLLRWMPVSKAEEKTTLPDNPLQEWYATLVWIEGRKHVLFTSASTLYSFLAPNITAALLKTRTPDIFCTVLRETMETDGFTGTSIHKLEVLLDPPLVLALTADRRVLGSMNDFLRIIRCTIEDTPSAVESMLPELNKQINHAPMSLLGYD